MITTIIKTHEDNMNIQDLALETKSVEIEFEALSGFKCKIGYVGAAMLRKLSSGASHSKMDRSGTLSKNFDEEEFKKAFSTKAVLGWSGLTYDYLSQLMLVDLDRIEDTSEEVPYSADNAYFLMKESTIFDNWIAERVNDLATFRT